MGITKHISTFLLVQQSSLDNEDPCDLMEWGCAQGTAQNQRIRFARGPQEDLECFSVIGFLSQEDE